MRKITITQNCEMLWSGIFGTTTEIIKLYPKFTITETEYNEEWFLKKNNGEEIALTHEEVQYFTRFNREYFNLKTEVDPESIF